ncbi:MAG TPA: hypothetical protein VJX67_15930 [Blastocatellia bacterium]|nr:hypothetical protein [Blastocatellia bacterium]
MKITCILLVLLSLMLSGCISGNGTQGASTIDSTTPYEPKPGSNEIDMSVIQSYLADYRHKSDAELNAAMDETDYNKRAAASYVRLERADVPVSEYGVTVVETRYLSDPKSAGWGFSLLGSLASLDIGKVTIEYDVLDYVEKNPQDPNCDYALWALGETGDTTALDQFIRIGSNPRTYGPRARERSFCCISQCGRYSGATRFENVPRILKIASSISDPQTQGWCLMALPTMAPGVHFGTIAEWQKWWDGQARLKGLNP